jgi:hypothetical protein
MNKENLRTEFREYLNETLPKIYFNNKELTWNPSKSEKDFKDRIKQRTELSESEFMKVIQKGIKLKEKEMPIDDSICMYFFISKFILILSTKEIKDNRSRLRPQWSPVRWPAKSPRRRCTKRRIGVLVWQKKQSLLRLELIDQQEVRAAMTDAKIK